MLTCNTTVRKETKMMDCRKTNKQTTFFLHLSFRFLFLFPALLKVIHSLLSVSFCSDRSSSHDAHLQISLTIFSNFQISVFCFLLSCLHTYRNLFTNTSSHDIPSNFSKRFFLPHGTWK